MAILAPYRWDEWVDRPLLDADIMHQLMDDTYKKCLTKPVDNNKTARELLEDAFMNKKPAPAPRKLSVPEIKEVIFNEEGNATIVIWADEDKTVVHCGEGERFDRYTGFMACIAKKMFGGTTTAKKLMNSKDKKYQAKLKAEKEAAEKMKRKLEAALEQKKAAKLREKRSEEALEELVKLFIMENEAKKRAAEIIAAKETEEKHDE